MTYVAYIHAKPTVEDAKGIFYVGKGTPQRAHSLKHRNEHHANVVRKYGKILVTTIECSTEEAAYELEKGIIRALRGMGVKLSNKTDGGAGIPGLDIESIKGDNHWSHRMPEKVKRGETHYKFGKKLSEKQKAKIHKVGSEHGMYGKGHLLSGEKHPRFGKPCPENVKAASSAANRGKVAWNKGKIGLRWLNNGIEAKQVSVSDVDAFLKAGWNYGMLKSEKNRNNYPFITISKDYFKKAA